MITAVKTKGVPLVWVGLPAIRGAKGTSDMLFLDSLYREAAAKAGITYVDVWDGLVDEGGLRRAHVGQGRSAQSSARPRRRFYLAAPRGRGRTSQR
jgi:hypothetical protein